MIPLRLKHLREDEDESSRLQIFEEDEDESARLQHIEDEVETEALALYESSWRGRSGATPLLSS